MPRKRPWLRHPATDPPQPHPCPTKLPRFRTVDLAQDSVPIESGLYFNAIACQHCGGAHLIEREGQAR